MKKFGLKPFLLKYGGYIEPGQFFYHRRLEERLANWGLRVISIQRYDEHPVWQIRLRAPLEAQAKLLLGKSYKGHRPACWASGKLIEARVKEELRSILKQLSPKIKAEEINVVRHGTVLDGELVSIRAGIPVLSLVLPSPTSCSTCFMPRATASCPSRFGRGEFSSSA